MWAPGNSLLEAFLAHGGGEEHERELDMHPSVRTMQCLLPARDSGDQATHSGAGARGTGKVMAWFSIFRLFQRSRGQRTERHPMAQCVAEPKRQKRPTAEFESELVGDGWVREEVGTTVVYSRPLPDAVERELKQDSEYLARRNNKD